MKNDLKLLSNFNPGSSDALVTITRHDQQCEWGSDVRGNYCKDDNVAFFFLNFELYITFLTLTIFN